MLKEIYEQPEGVRETIGDRVRHGKLVLEGIGLSDKEIRNLRRIVILACGTSYHAGVVGRYVIEEWARIPVEPDIASEWRYRNPVLSKDTLVIGISQSGETADVLAAMKLAREKGARTVAITNMMGSQITREVDSVLYTRTGLEVGVAASKTFTAQVALIRPARAQARRGEEDDPRGGDRVHPRPALLASGEDAGLPRREPSDRGDRPALLRQAVLPLPRPPHRPARRARGRAEAEGDLVHPDRGVLGRRDEARADRAPRQDTPVVCIATNSHVYDKVVSNIQETRARGAHVIAIATDGNEDIQHHADDVIYVPKTPAFLQAALAILPLQLLAYRIARLRGMNVDQPRNLAKTVTVE